MKLVIDVPDEDLKILEADLKTIPQTLYDYNSYLRKKSETIDTILKEIKKYMVDKNGSD